MADIYAACGCSLGGTGRGRAVDELLALGFSAVKVEEMTRAKQMTVKRETVSRHLRVCLLGKRPVTVPAQVSTFATPPEHATAKQRDLARMVQEKTVEALEAGTLKVTVKDGLAATALLDKREARNEDRRFMLGLARLLSGAGMVGPQGDSPDVIDVTPPNPLLAPPALRAK